MRKLLFLTTFMLCLLVNIQLVRADVCCPDDPDFDAVACTGGGGSVLPAGCGAGGPGPTPTPVPIDGGLAAFALGAAAFSLHKIHKRKKTGSL